MSLAVVVNGYRNSYDCTDHCVYMYEHYDRSFCGSALMTECFNRCICELNQRVKTDANAPKDTGTTKGSNCVTHVGALGKRQCGQHGYKGQYGMCGDTNADLIKLSNKRQRQSGN